MFLWVLYRPQGPAFSTSWLSPSGFYRNLLYETLNRGSECTIKVRILWCLWWQGSSFTQESSLIILRRSEILWKKQCYSNNKYLYDWHHFVTLCAICINCPMHIIPPKVCWPHLIIQKKKKFVISSGKIIISHNCKCSLINVFIKDQCYW